MEKPIHLKDEQHVSIKNELYNAIKKKNFRRVC